MLKTLLRRVLIAACLFAAVFFGTMAAKRYMAARCPVREIRPAGYSSLETEGMKLYGKKKKNGFRTTAFDSCLYLENDGADIRAVEFDVTFWRRRKGTTENTIEVYYDRGYGFREEDCVKVRLRKGVCRAFFDTASHVKRIRVDFFNNEGARIRLDSIRLNPDTYGGTGTAWLFGAAALLLLTLMTCAGGTDRFVMALLSFPVLMAACATPFVQTLRDNRMPAFFILGMLAAFLTGSLLMEEGAVKERVFTAALIALTFSVYYYFALITPYAEGPDEAMHHDVVFYICEHGVIPRGDDPEIRNKIWGFSYAFSPILPFIIGGYIERIAVHFTHSWHQLVMTARMVSIVSGTLTVLFSWKLSKLLFKKSPVRYLLPVLIGFMPELVFINTYVNSDAMAIMASTMILFFWASGIEHDWRVRDAVGLSAAMGICGLTYYNCYGFVLLSIPMFFYSVAKGRKNRTEIIRMTALIVILTFLFCGWWFIRNLVIYHGDLLGQKSLNALAEIYAADGYKPSQIKGPMEEGHSLRYMFFELEWLSKTLTSMIAMFSHYVLRARSYVYTLYKVLAGAGLAGFLFAAGRMLYRRKRGEDDPMRTAFFLHAVLSVGIVFVLAVYYSYCVDFQPQGRYILPCVVPLAALVTEGFEAAGEGAERLAERVRHAAAPVRYRVSFAAALLSICCMMNILFDTIASFYLG